MANPKAEQAEVFGKAELCARLGWSRPRLDRRLESDANFPVMKRGNRQGGWEFDIDAIVAYLDGAVLEQKAAAVPAPVAVVAPAAEGAPGAAHRGEGTASQRLKNAQAAREEDKLRLARGELLEAEEMRLVVGTMLAHLGKGIDGLPDMIVRRLSLPDDAAPVLREMVDDLRRVMVADLKPLLGGS